MPLAATALLCLVIAVGDGDTLRARCDGHDGVLTVRLAGIDAPERRQPFGAAARRALSALCLKARAEVRPQPGTAGHDRYGRRVAQVRCRGVDAGQAQLRAGLAWAAQRYLDDWAPLAIEHDARAARRGLWADRAPVAPWDWRKAHPRA